MTTASASAQYDQHLLKLDGVVGGSFVNSADGTLEHTNIAAILDGGSYRATPGDYVCNTVAISQLRLEMDGGATEFEASLDLDCALDERENAVPNMRCVFLDSSSPQYEAFLGNGEVARSIAILSAVVRLTQPMDRVWLLVDGSSVTNMVNTPDGTLNHTHAVLDVEVDGLVATYGATEGDLVVTSIPGGVSQLRLVVVDAGGVVVTGASFSAVLGVA
eukprot:scaffold24900_cov132-Isochrysis_galbana.AAC.9